MRQFCPVFRQLKYKTFKGAIYYIRPEYICEAKRFYTFIPIPGNFKQGKLAFNRRAFNNQSYTS